jgi:hypothetical protein
LFVCLLWGFEGSFSAVYWAKVLFPRTPVVWTL